MLVACGGGGVPPAEHAKAIADADQAKKERDAGAKELEDAKRELGVLRTKISQIEGTKPGACPDAEDVAELKRQKDAAEARAKLFDDFIKRFQKMIDAGKLEVTTRRGQVVLALDTDVLFDEGKTDIKDDGKAALKEVGEALRGVQGRRFQVAGHTDAVPIKTKEFPSNWELSSARAIAVVKLLIKEGVRANTLSAAGHAEFDPVGNNVQKSGRAKNRRIEIVVVPNVEELIRSAEKTEKKAATK